MNTPDRSDTLHASSQPTPIAKLAQLAYAGMRFLSLSQFYGPAIGADEDNTHTRANTQLFNDIVQYVYDHPDEFPAIDTKENILWQLPSLNAEDVKRIAVGIFESRYPGSEY